MLQPASRRKRALNCQVIGAVYNCLNAELDAFEFTIVLSSAATTTGFGFAVSGPAPPTYIDYIVTYQTTANGAPGTTDVITQRHNIGYDAMTATPSTITANVNLHAHIK